MAQVTINGDQIIFAHRPPTEKDNYNAPFWIDAGENPWTIYLNLGNGNWEKK
jgi:hypothetical protein